MIRKARKIQEKSEEKGREPAVETLNTNTGFICCCERETAQGLQNGRGGDPPRRKLCREEDQQNNADAQSKQRVILS